MPHYPTRTLRSQNAGFLLVPVISKISLGGGAFGCQAPLLWNQLPVQVQGPDKLSMLKMRVTDGQLIIWLEIVDLDFLAIEHETV